MHSSRSHIAVFLLLLTPIMLAGCNESTEPTATATADASSDDTQVALCTKCGQIKGTDVCCAQGQPTCAKCGLVKGSPGCCRLTKGSTEPAYLCAKCGHIKGTADCCQPGQPTCSKCGLVKGAPGCCKIKTAG